MTHYILFMFLLPLLRYVPICICKIRRTTMIFICITLAFQGVGFSRKTNGFRNYQSSHDSSMLYIGLRILKTQGCRAAYNIYMHESAGGSDYVNSREISCELVLDPYPKGYTIVPSTIHPGEEAPFVLSVFSKAPIKLEAI